MSKAIDHGLTEQQLEIIRRILAQFADKIDRVDLFGSRAQGTHRPNSDVDLVVRGNIDEKTADRLWTLFNESSLALKVDVLVYEQVKKAALRKHMDLVNLPLFMQSDLLQDAKRRENPTIPSNKD